MPMADAAESSSLMPPRLSLPACFLTKWTQTVRVTGYSKGTNGVWYYDVEVHQTRNRCYTVRRRYNDFVKLYNGLISIIPAEQVPSLPAKTSLWRFFTGVDTDTLRQRKQMFERLLLWIESQPLGKGSKAYVKFLGTPPDSKGYISLHEYSSQDWLTTVAELRARKLASRRSTIHAPTATALDKLMPVEFKSFSELRYTEKIATKCV